MEALKGQLLDAYLDSIPAQAYIKDLNGKYLYLNQECKDAFGVTDLEEQKEIEFHDQLTRKDWQTVLSGQKVMQREETLVNIKFPIRDDNGAVVAVGSLVQEFCSQFADRSCQTMETSPLSPAAPSDPLRNQVDEETKVDEPCTWKGCKSYRKLFHSMHTGAFMGQVITDDNNKPTDFVFLEVNPSYEALTGLKKEETIGKRASEVLVGIQDDPYDWIGKLGGVALTGKNYRFEHGYCGYTQKWFGGIAYRPDGEERRFVALFLDVSETVEAQEATRESEERHRNLFESMVQGVVYQAASGSIIAANPSAARILGLSVDQIMGRMSVDPRWRSIKEDGSDFPGETHPAMVALKTGKAVTGVVMGVLHPGDVDHHWILIDAIPRFRPGETEPFQVYTTFTDLTATKRLERQLRQEKERAEMADTLKSAFLANMSHEIRTPLNGIIGHIDLALSNRLATDRRQENLEGLAVARHSGDLLISIIQDILDLSKIEAGQMTINGDEVFSLRNVVDQTKSLAQTMIKQREKTISYQETFENHVCDFVQGDPYRLQQVLNNLVSNAVKFTDKGRVELGVRLADAETIEFCVSDTGKGIPKDHLESIFEPFRQVEIGDTRKHGGTGLGLTISRKLVKMMGGELRLASSMEGEKKGSRFTFTFPYKPGQFSSKQRTPTHHMRKSFTNDESPCVARKILVAEDETVSRRLVSRMLKISGYDVIVAENGFQAVEQYKQYADVALILMDVQMPIMDGLEATRVIRQLESESPERESVPIIALSAGAMKGDNERGLAVGMTDYLTKPVNFKLLVKTLKTYLGQIEESAKTNSVT